VEDAVEQFEVARRHLGFALPDNHQPCNPRKKLMAPKLCGFAANNRRAGAATTARCCCWLREPVEPPKPGSRSFPSPRSGRATPISITAATSMPPASGFAPVRAADSGRAIAPGVTFHYDYLDYDFSSRTAFGDAPWVTCSVSGSRTARVRRGRRMVLRRRALGGMVPRERRRLGRIRGLRRHPECDQSICARPASRPRLGSVQPH